MRFCSNCRVRFALIDASFEKNITPLVPRSSRCIRKSGCVCCIGDLQQHRLVRVVPALHDDAGRLVDEEESVVFVKDIERGHATTLNNCGGDA